MITPLPDEVTTCLEVIGGKYAKIESTRSRKPQLVVKHSQKDVPYLTVYKVPSSQDRSIHMAFCFKLKEDKYYPVVEWDSATKKPHMKIMGPINKPFVNFPGTHLFRWDTNGEYGSLRSVAEPNQYLSVSESKVITLRSTPDLSFRINLNTPKSRMASSSLHPLTPFMFGLSLIQNWPSVAYSVHSTFDDDSDMKKDRKIQAIL
ncbi:uncharacterized protein LOC113537164 [Pangasianodon hypophthalmus]|uniref:uncharacterized protein LOC113537164 n=1 Tax=Pangasianodon hypophthalmus TaxID=310915 RepID=UPI000F00D0F5|nr:uncharacterized protein LOC113537164 [Pangasianodon hypophthalmus]